MCIDIFDTKIIWPLNIWTWQPCCCRETADNEVSLKVTRRTQLECCHMTKCTTQCFRTGFRGLQTISLEPSRS